jgi:hypothetical protein
MYIPKSQISENLYTPGKEWWYVDNGLEYAGFYYKLSTGKAFTGKNPNAPSSREIYQSKGGIDEKGKYSEFSDDGTGIVNFSQIADEYDGIIPGSDNIQQPQDLDVYNKLKSVDVTKTKFLPLYEQTLPNAGDYEMGYFTRYFAVPLNSFEFMEISKKTYDELDGKNSDWEWIIYKIFTIQWTIVGTIDAVFLTNQNMISIVERKIHKMGLGKYLSNKLEYFLYPEEEQLLAIPDLLITGTGEDYVGYYHIHPIQGPMEGPTHWTTPHLRLFYKRFYRQIGAKVTTTILKPNVIVLGDGSPVDYNTLTQQSTSPTNDYKRTSSPNGESIINSPPPMPGLSNSSTSYS